MTSTGKSGVLQQYLLGRAKVPLFVLLAAPLSLGALAYFTPASVSLPRLLIAALCLWPFTTLLVLSARIVDDWQDWEKDSAAGKELGASKKALGILSGFCLIVPAAAALFIAPLAAASLVSYAAVLLLPRKLHYIKSLLCVAAASAMFGFFSQTLIGRTVGLRPFIYCGLWLSVIFISFRTIKSYSLKVGLLIALFALPLFIRGVCQ